MPELKTYKITNQSGLFSVLVRAYTAQAAVSILLDFTHSTDAVEKQNTWCQYPLVFITKNHWEYHVTEEEACSQ